MKRSHAPLGSSLLVLLLALACTEAGSEADEVGETGDGDGDGDGETYTSTYSTSEDSSSSTDSNSTDTSDSSSSTDSSDSSSSTDTSDSSSSTDSSDSSSSTDTSDSSSSTDATDSSSSSSSESGTTGDEAPFVISTIPEDLDAGVPPNAGIALTFSEPMDAATITTNTANALCTGSVQVSADNFVTCVQMAAAPDTLDDQTFALDPVANLASVTTYQIRVLGEASDAGGTPMDAEFITPAGFLVRYYHTIAMDGVNEFTADESFATSTMGQTAYVAWDDTYVYLGMTSQDLANNSAQVWLVAYLGGPNGNNLGVNYNTQQPLMAFDARWHLRWRANDSFGGALEWNGAAWINPGFGPTAGSTDVGVNGSFFEMRVAWTNIGSPDLLDVHMGMLREQNFAEASWAAFPASSYVDGYDPNYSKYFEFDVSGSTLPADHDPL
ncbi:Ig-like domain-containing protein [Nannocystaceae bacterium ST9]